MLFLASTALSYGNWTRLADGPWAAREGLMAVDTPAGLLMTGGRKTFGALATNDVWRTANGSSWLELPKAPYKARAYHAMFYHDECVFVMGGQTVSFIGNPFYNDVLSSPMRPATHAFLPRCALAP